MPVELGDSARKLRVAAFVFGHHGAEAALFVQRAEGRRRGVDDGVRIRGQITVVLRNSERREEMWKDVIEDYQPAWRRGIAPVVLQKDRCVFQQPRIFAPTLGTDLRIEDRGLFELDVAERAFPPGEPIAPLRPR